MWKKGPNNLLPPTTLKTEGTVFEDLNSLQQTVSRGYGYGEDTLTGDDYKLWTYARDELGNEVMYASDFFWFDNTAPTIVIGPNGATWSQEKDIDITFEDPHSGLSEENTYEYGISNSSSTEPSSWTTISDGTLSVDGKTYTKRITIGSGLNGTYYLWIKKIADACGNESSALISSAFKFDNIKPSKITFNPPSNSNWTKGQSVIVTATDSNNDSGNTITLKYQWTTSTSEPAESTWNSATSVSNGSKITNTTDSGIYYLHVRAYDKAGNYLYGRGGTYKIDNKSPNITFNPTNGTTWKKEYQISITVIDEHVNNLSELKYQWTTSSTAPEESTWSTATTFTVNSEGVGTITNNTSTGKMYLWVRAKDSLSNTAPPKGGQYYLDNKLPTIVITCSNANSWTKSKNLTITWQDTNSGLNTSNEYQYAISDQNTVVPANGWVDISNFSQNTTTKRVSTITIGEEQNLNGNKYLWIKAIKDKTSPNNTSDYGKSMVLKFDNSGLPYTVTVTKKPSAELNNYIKSMDVKVTAGYDGNSAQTCEYRLSTSSTSPTASDANTGTIFSNKTTAQEVTKANIGSTLTSTDTYYLWVTVYDALGNSNECSNSTEFAMYDSKKWYKISVNNDSTYKFDNLGPEITFTPNSRTWQDSQEVTVTVIDANVNTIETGKKIYYAWSDSNENAPTFTENVALNSLNSAKITKDDTEGTYYLWVKARDGLGNETISHSGEFCIDKTAPVVSFSVNEQLTWVNGNKEVALTFNDNYSGLPNATNDNNSPYKYKITTESTLPTSGWVSLKNSDFTNNTVKSKTASINLNNLSGQYYIWVKAVSDNAGNTTDNIRSNVFKLDNNTKPSSETTINLAYTISAGWVNSASIGITIKDTDNLSGLNLTGSGKPELYISTSYNEKSSAYDASGTGDSNSPIINPNLTKNGNQYTGMVTIGGSLASQTWVWVKAKDNAGNSYTPTGFTPEYIKGNNGNIYTNQQWVAEYGSNSYKNVDYYIIGPFRIDTIAPVVSVSVVDTDLNGYTKTDELAGRVSNETDYSPGKKVTITITEIGSGLKSNNSYKYYLSTSSTSEEGGSWQNYTSGITFNINNPSLNGTRYLRIKSIGDNFGNYFGTENLNLTIATLHIDNTAPVISITSSDSTINPISGMTEYKKSIPITITVSDNSDFITGTVFKYGLSTSNTTAPTSWKTFTPGTEIPKLGEGLTGDYYLWIGTISDAWALRDYSRHINTASAKTGVLKFDNSGPECEVKQQKKGNIRTIDGKQWSQGISFSIRVIDENAGLDSNCGEYIITNSNGSVKKTGAIVPGENTITPGEWLNRYEGKIYLLISVKDKLNNYSNSQNEVDGINFSQSYLNETWDYYGAFWIDNIGPSITLWNMNGNGTSQINASFKIGDNGIGTSGTPITNANVELIPIGSTEAEIQNRSYAITNNGTLTLTRNNSNPIGGVFRLLGKNFYGVDLLGNQSNQEVIYGNNFADAIIAIDYGSATVNVASTALGDNNNRPYKKSSVPVTVDLNFTGSLSSTTKLFSYSVKQSLTKPTTQPTGNYIDVFGEDITRTIKNINNGSEVIAYTGYANSNASPNSDIDTDLMSKEITPFTECTTGVHWLYIKPETDSFGNTGIGKWYGPFYIDAVKSDVEVQYNYIGNSARGYNKGGIADITITITDDVGLSTTWYKWVSTIPTTVSSNLSGVTQITGTDTLRTVTIKQQSKANKYLIIYSKDSVGNITEFPSEFTKFEEKARGNNWICLEILNQDWDTPVVSATVSNANIWEQEKTITLTVTDTEAGLENLTSIQYKFSQEGEWIYPPATLTGNATTKTATITTIGLPDGLNSMWVNLIQDGVGNDKPSGKIINNQIKIDTTPPVWELVSAGGDDSTNINSLTVDIKGTDNHKFGYANLTDLTVSMKVDNITQNVTVINSNLTYSSDKELDYSLELDISNIINALSGQNLDDVQLSLVLESGSLYDEAQNTNIQTILDLTVSALRLTNTETIASSPFLGNNSVQRQYVNSVTFLSELGDHTVASNVWDVSSLSDRSILAWYEETTVKDNNNNDVTAYNVYVYSWTGHVEANRNSSYLFANLGTGLKNGVTIDYTGLYTEKTTNMSHLYEGTKFNGNQTINIDTRNVTNMQAMFKGATIVNDSDVKSLTIGSNFKINKVSNMKEMFRNTLTLTDLYLGAHFNKVAENNTNMLASCGANGAVIHVAESIYKDNTHLKFNSTDTTAINSLPKTTAGRTIEPYYKPYWEITNSTVNTTNSSVTLTLVGKSSDGTLTSNLTTNDIKVFVNNTEITSITKTLTSGASGNSSGIYYKNYTLKLSDFEEASRQAGVPYKEWSGHISIKIDGRGQATSTYTKNVLVDSYGNQSMTQTDESGTWNDVSVMYDELIDTINPEITYIYSSTDINDISKTVTIDFSIVDKYFSSSSLTLNKLKVKFDGTIADSDITKNLTKLEDELYDTDGDGTLEKVGEKYRLVISNIEQEIENGETFRNYSGPVSLIIPKDIAVDTTGNKNLAKTITVGINAPDETGEEITVDFVKPIWTYVTSSIERKRDGKTLDKVHLEVRGSDKYLNKTTSKLVANNIKVYYKDPNDNSFTEVITIIKSVNKITPDNVAGIVYYSIDLLGFENFEPAFDYANFEHANFNITIDAGTLKDGNNNQSELTRIYIGNPEWVEAQPPEPIPVANAPKYSAFRESTVDFKRPIIKYSGYNIDYVNKKVTININIQDNFLNRIDNKLYTETLDNLKIKMFDSNNITDEITPTKRVISKQNNGTAGTYTIELSNFKESTKRPNFDYFENSGYLILEFPENFVMDTSGNGNVATNLTLQVDPQDSGSNPQLVDVINPVFEFVSSSINRTNETVEIYVRGSDEYIANYALTSSNVVAIVDGKVTNSINIGVQEISTGSTTTSKLFKITLSNFGENSGTTKIRISKDAMIDTSGNGNIRTDILVGDSNSLDIPFRDSEVDFVAPEWRKLDSSIYRVRDGSTEDKVTITLEAHDTKYVSDSLDTNKIHVLIKDKGQQNYTEISSITKTLETVTTYSKENDGITFKTYLLTLKNFGTHDGQVKITIDANTILDKSAQLIINENPNADYSDHTNEQAEFGAGNATWIEAGDNVQNPKYLAFRNDIVDFINPEITYIYTADVNPVIDIVNKTVTVGFTIKENNMYLETGNSSLSANDFDVYIDGKLIGNQVNKQFTITNTGDTYNISLVLSGFEQANLIGNDLYKKYSGVIEIKPKSTKDTSGNVSSQAKVIVDNDNGDSLEDGVVIDFIKPYISIDENKLDTEAHQIEINFSVTDRFYKTSDHIVKNQIHIYSVNDDDSETEITSSYNFTLTETELNDKTGYGNYFICGYSYKLLINGVEDEDIEIKVPLAQNIVRDTSNNGNDAYTIDLIFDKSDPIWKYESVDSSKLDSHGELTIIVKGSDKHLDVVNSKLTRSNVKLFRDRTDITASTSFTVTKVGDVVETKNQNGNTINKEVTYKIKLTGITQVGAYTVLLEKGSLIDTYGNKNRNTTITMSKSTISSLDYQEVKYINGKAIAYINELLTINESGTNNESTTYTASSFGEVYNDQKNKEFAEPFSYSNGTQNAKSFAGWKDSDNNIYKAHDEVPSTVKELTATWQDAKVIFVSSSQGSSANDGLSPETPVSSLESAFGKLSNSETDMTKQIVVIMDEVTWNNLSSTDLNKNATITSLYGGIDYEHTNNAKLKISSNMNIYADIRFDDINITSTSTTVSSNMANLASSNYTNLLIANYNDLILGRRISTDSGYYTFGGVIGGNYKTETNTGNIGIHKMIVESGKYNDLVIGSSLSSPSTTKKNLENVIEIGSRKDGSRGQNNNLTITNLELGQNEKALHTSTLNHDYANVRLNAGTISNIYMTSLGGQVEDHVKFGMFGGNVANVYGGTTTQNALMTTLNFYGGTVTNAIYGQGINSSFIGDTEIRISGISQISGDVYGGSDNTAGTGNTHIYMDSNSAIVSGNIYGGSKNSSLTGNTDINISAGTVSGDIFGGGYTSGNTGNTNVTIRGGTISGNIYGGSYNGIVTGNTNVNIEDNAIITGDIYGGGYQDSINSTLRVTGNTNVNIFGGTIGTANGNKNIYGGNRRIQGVSLTNADKLTKSVVNIGETGSLDLPIVYSTIYGGGAYDSITLTELNLIQNNGSNRITAFGGSNIDCNIEETQVNVKGATANKIYGSSNGVGTVIESNVRLESGTVEKVFGGGLNATVTSSSNISLVSGDFTSTLIYGGSETSGIVPEANINLEGGTYGTVFGGGLNVGVTESNINVNGATVNNVYGGGQTSGTTVTSNITLTSGNATNVFGGALNTNVTTSNIEIPSESTGTVKNIYGGGSISGNLNSTVTSSNISIKGGTKSGNTYSIENIYGGGLKADVTTSNIMLEGGITKNIYGGGKTSGTTTNSNVSIQSGTANNVYGGGYNGADVTNAVVTKTGGDISSAIYGGGYLSGTTTNTVVNVSSNVKEVYGGGNYGAVTINSTVNISENSSVTKSVYGGGNNGATIGTSTSNGTATVNIVGGTISEDVYGGGKYNNNQVSLVYGTTNVNIGASAVNNNSLVPGAIDIAGFVYGAGTSEYSENRYSANVEGRYNEATYNYETTTVQGNTNIKIDGRGANISIGESIFGAGNASTYSGTSTITIENYGTVGSVPEIMSIQRTNNLNIGNSVIELMGANDCQNSNQEKFYTLNRIGNLTLYNNAMLHVRRGFNIVEEYNSLVTLGGAKASATVSNENAVSIPNVMNRIYTLEGTSDDKLIFAKNEVIDYDEQTQTQWSVVNGLTFFGLYAYGDTEFLYGQFSPRGNINTSEVVFSGMGVIEAKHKQNHNIKSDGFYTADEQGNLTLIETIPEDRQYYDWKIGTELDNQPTDYTINLIASAYGRQSSAVLAIEQYVKPGQKFEIKSISTNSFRSGFNIVEPSLINDIELDNSTGTTANNTFGLDFRTGDTVWINEGRTVILTADGGTLTGDTIYKKDYSEDAGQLIFKIYNSTNITKNQDLGRIIIELEETYIDEQENEATRKVLIGVNIRTVVEQLNTSYMPRFKDSLETLRKYTSDSTVDMTYKLYYVEDYDSVGEPSQLYSSTDKRALVSKTMLPIGTKIALIDKVTNKNYYYQVKNTVNLSSNGYYVYKLSNFNQMGSKQTSNYQDNNEAYFSTSHKFTDRDGTQKLYAHEEYEVMFEFSEATITNNINLQEIYLVLLNSSDAIKYDRAQEIKFDQLVNKNAQLTYTITNVEDLEESYTLSDTYVNNIEISLDISASILEQKEGLATVIDTKYHEQKSGIIVEVIDNEGNRIKQPDIENFRVTIGEETFTPDTDGGAIRIPMSKALSTLQHNMIISLKQKSVEDGTQGVIRISYFASEDGEYYSDDITYIVDKNLVQNDIDVEFEGTDTGIDVIVTDGATRIIKSETGENLAGGNGLDMTINMALDPNSNEKLVVKLFKRNATFDASNNHTITYTAVNLKNYLAGEWTQYKTNEYTLLSVNNTGTDNLSRTFEFKKQIKTGISTGEYRLEFYIYKDNTIVQKAYKTFIVTN